MTEAQMNANEDTLDTLDETLDDLADMPETKPFPAGAHLITLVTKRNTKKKGAYIMEMTHKEVVEQTDTVSPPPNPGDKSTLFISTLDKEGKKVEFAQGQLKIFLGPIGAMLGTNSISEILEAGAKGIDGVAVCAIRKSKDPQYDDQQSVKLFQLV